MPAQSGGRLRSVQHPRQRRRFRREPGHHRGLLVSDEVLIEIRDDGPGYAPDILLRVGEPYVTTRSAAENGGQRDGAEDLGLGLFIAKTLIERSGAIVPDERRPAGDRRHRADRLAAPRV